MSQLIFENVNSLLKYIESNYDNDKAFNEKRPEGWVSISHKNWLNEVKYLALYLHSIGVKKGKNIGILSPSNIRWTIADMAVLAAGAANVPLFANISEENFVFECTQPDVKTLFVSGPDQWKMYEKHKDLFDNVIALDETQEKGVIDYESALRIGREIDKNNPELYHTILAAIDKDDMGSIIYTSGSTGVPKGVVYSQFALIGACLTNLFGWTKENDRYLNILPLPHIFGRIVNYLFIGQGIPIYYVTDPKTIGEACKEVHPTTIALVPRVLEKIYASVVAKAESQDLLKRTIAHWAFSLANAEEGGLLKTLFHPIADKIVFSNIRNALGGSFRVIISGGAPLNPHLNHFFCDIGMPIYEGYGLTELGICSVNNIEKSKIGTVGVPIPFVEMKTSADGELLIKNLFKTEYYKNPEATKELYDEEGWLRSGDKAEIDENGFVTLVGRIKELVKTSIGEYIAPVPIEQELCKVPFIDLSMVVAEHRKFVSVLIFPNYEVVERLKNSQNHSEMSNEEFLNSPYIKAEMDKLLESINAHLNHWEQIHAYRFVAAPPTIESGELTPSMKIKRDVIQKKYKDLIDSMYD
jgi:long-chain acyl-CoA synthetase